MSNASLKASNASCVRINNFENFLKSFDLMELVIEIVTGFSYAANSAATKVLVENHFERISERFVTELHNSSIKEEQLIINAIMNKHLPELADDDFDMNRVDEIAQAALQAIAKQAKEYKCFHQSQVYKIVCQIAERMTVNLVLNAWNKVYNV